MEIAVFGSGGWGTALAILLHQNGHQVTLWSYLEEESHVLRQKRENPLLPGVSLPELAFTSDPACARGKHLIVMAPPSFAARSTAETIAPYLEQDAVLVSATKGIERGTSLRMSQILEEVTGRTVAVLSGPSHAEEVGRNIPTGCVAACRDLKTAQMVQDVFMNERFRVYSSPDVVGVELGAALKNVIALGAGICDGMGFGDNTKALLMTRGLTEIARLGMALGARQDTFAGLAGVGDLIVTCTSMHSRNRRAGILIGKGETPEQAMKEVGAVVEGYYATASAMELAKKVGVEMPITEATYAVLYKGVSVQQMQRSLMTRTRTTEVHAMEDSGWT